MLFFKNIYLWVVLVAFVSSCSRDIKKIEPIDESYPTAIEQALGELEALLLHVNNNLLVIDSTHIEAHITPQNLECVENICRSEVTLGNILLKKVFKCNNGIINAVHYDFYYDSLALDLEKDTQAVISLVATKFGDHNSIYNSGTMKTFSWVSHNNIIDLELFNNGFTVTIRKSPKTETPAEIALGLPKHLQLAEKLIHHIYEDSLKLGVSTIKDIQSLFKVDFKGKSNALAFSKTYNNRVLLSGMFLFKRERLSNVYFDYVYSDTTSKEFLINTKTIKSIITELYKEPSNIATVPLSTSYRWGNNPIVLEMYSDGFSVFLENNSL